MIFPQQKKESNGLVKKFLNFLFQINKNFYSIFFFFGLVNNLNERGKMSVFQQNLPIQILPNSNNPEGTKYQGLLDAMESSAMKIKMDSTFFQIDISGSISVEFSMSNYNFQFDSSILSKGNNSIISIEKPKVIHKSQIRKTQRLRTNIPFNFSKLKDIYCLINKRKISRGGKQRQGETNG